MDVSQRKEESCHSTNKDVSELGYNTAVPQPSQRQVAKTAEKRNKPNNSNKPRARASGTERPTPQTHKTARPPSDLAFPNLTETNSEPSSKPTVKQSVNLGTKRNAKSQVASKRNSKLASRKPLPSSQSLLRSERESESQTVATPTQLEQENSKRRRLNSDVEQPNELVAQRKMRIQWLKILEKVGRQYGAAIVDAIQNLDTTPQDLAQLWAELQIVESDIRHETRRDSPSDTPRLNLEENGSTKAAQANADDAVHSRIQSLDIARNRFSRKSQSFAQNASLMNNDDLVTLRIPKPSEGGALSVDLKISWRADSPVTITCVENDLSPKAGIPAPPVEPTQKSTEALSDSTSADSKSSRIMSQSSDTSSPSDVSPILVEEVERNISDRKVDRDDGVIDLTR